MKNYDRKKELKKAGIICGLIVLILLIWGIISISTNGFPKNIKNAEITSPDNKLIYSIANRDAFTWTNVSIRVNDYYNCGSFGDVNPESEIQFNAANCGDFITKYSSVSKIKIISDQGELNFGR